jgi:hypothetical protein
MNNNHKQLPILLANKPSPKIEPLLPDVSESKTVRHIAELKN